MSYQFTYNYISIPQLREKLLFLFLTKDEYLAPGCDVPTDNILLPELRVQTFACRGSKKILRPAGIFYLTANINTLQLSGYTDIVLEDYQLDEHELFLIKYKFSEIRLKFNGFLLESFVLKSLKVF